MFSSGKVVDSCCRSRLDSMMDNMQDEDQELEAIKARVS